MSDQWKLDDDIFGVNDPLYIDLQINLSKDLLVQSVSITRNDTELVPDYKLLKLIAFAILKGLEVNKDDILIQELFRELGLKKSKQ